jgi:hypothetical protein
MLSTSEIQEQLETARATGRHIPGITKRRCTDIVVRYHKAGLRNKVENISEEEYLELEEAATTDPCNLELPRAWKTVFHFNCDRCIHPEAWEADELSLSDIEHCLEQAEPKELWKTNYMFGLPTTAAATKLQTLLNEAVELKGNPSTLKNLLQHLDATLFPRIAHRPSKLTCHKDTHEPKLPVHRWTQAQCDEMIRTYERIGQTYKAALRWKGHLVVPAWVYQNYYIEFVEVIPKEEYDLRFGPALMPLSEPITFEVGGEVMCDTSRSFLVRGTPDCNWNQVLMTMCGGNTATSAPPLPIVKVVEEDKTVCDEDSQEETVTMKLKKPKKQSRTSSSSAASASSSSSKDSTIVAKNGVGKAPMMEQQKKTKKTTSTKKKDTQVSNKSTTQKEAKAASSITSTIPPVPPCVQRRRSALTDAASAKPESLLKQKRQQQAKLAKQKKQS